MVVGIAAIAGLLPACGGSAGTEGSGDTRRAAPADSRGARVADAPSTVQTPTTAKAICPATGTWQICSVVERLERAGLAPRREPGEVREAPLSAPGVAFALGKSELRVFVYADRASRERDQAKLDRRKYASASQPLSIQAEPTLIVSENLLGILRSRSDHQRERVSDALTAGPPQRSGTKS